MLKNQLPCKKRRRQEVEKYYQGFGEHRTKRRNAATSHQIVPVLNLLATQNSSCYMTQLNRPSSSPITLRSAELEKESSRTQPGICFIQKASSQSTASLFQSSPDTPFCHKEDTPLSPFTIQGTRNIFLGDTDMYDSMHISPELIYQDVSSTTCTRIPTPIYSSFDSFKKTGKPSIYIDGVKDDSIVKINRTTRFHSPIIEEDKSPSIIITGLNEMQMNVENSPQFIDETQNSKNNLNIHPWLSFKPLAKNTSGCLGSEEAKKSFSMGYRANCEKCRMKVPGHFSHIIPL